MEKNNILELVNNLPEVYQPIYGHLDLNLKTSRICDDRLELVKKIYNQLSTKLNRGLKVLDLGCAQGFFSLHLASMGASVKGVDFLDKNIILAQALADENPSFDITFEVGRVEDTISNLADNQYDLVIGFSVFHHIVYEFGLDYTKQLIKTLSQKVKVGLFELALRQEPLYWAQAQAQEPQELIESFYFIKKIAQFHNHLSNINRPFFIASNKYFILNDFIEEIQEYKVSSHKLSNNTHQNTRKYYITSNSFIKVLSFANEERKEINKNEFENETSFLRKINSINNSFPKLIMTIKNGDEAILIREKLDGLLLSEIIENKIMYNPEDVINSVLSQLVILEQQGFYHNDLRTWNIIVSNNNYKLIDFGAISSNNQDCIWPYDTFLSLINFIQEVYLHTTIDATLLRGNNFDYQILPKPYSNAFGKLFSLNQTEITFKKLQELIKNNEDFDLTSAGILIYSKALNDAIKLTNHTVYHMTNQKNALELQANNLLNEKNNIANENNNLLAQREHFINEKNQLTTQLSSLINTNSQLLDQSNHLVNEKNELLHKSNHLLNEKNELLNQSNSLVNEKNELLHQSNHLINQKNELLARVDELTKDKQILNEQINNFVLAKEKLLAEISMLIEDKNNLLDQNTLLIKEKYDNAVQFSALVNEKNDLVIQTTNLSNEKNDLSIQLANITNEKDTYFNIIQKLEQDNNYLTNSLQEANQQIEHLSKSYNSVINSNSWKMTKSLREVGKLVKTFAKPTQVHIEEKTKLVETPTKSSTIFVDITHVYKHDLKTGIQRVVRSIVAQMQLKYDNIEPIFLTDEGGFWSYRYTNDPTTIINPQQNDVFIGIDLNSAIIDFYHTHTFAEWRNKGVHINFVVYDILPVLYPMWWPENVGDVHKLWIETVLKVSHSVLCISHTVQKDVEAYLENNQNKINNNPTIGWFHLGADVENSIPSKGMPDDANIVLEHIQSMPTFIMVGTIEPRKGHKQSILAFSKLWEKNINVNLVIVGKKGWLVDDVIELIKNHKELNKKLFWLESISDEYLEKIYSFSSCLLNASEGEGFGLPLIESARHKLPILSRDLPIFREVAIDFAYYFAHDKDEMVLANAIIEWLELYKENKHPKSDDMPWISWAKSAEKFISLLKGV